VLAPRLARSEDLVSFQAEKLFVADVLRERNVALSCARRAEKIALGGRVGEYGDITPIYVRLAEAEVKLKRK